MDLEYMWKKLTGTLTYEDEQAYRAHIAEQQSLRAPPVAVPQPVQVQPGNALRSNQDLMADAMAEMRRQSAPVARSPEQQARDQEAELARRSVGQFSGVRD